MLGISSLLALGLLSFVKSTAAAGPFAVNLRTAGNFAILAKSGISTVPSSSIVGDVGLSPAAGSFLTGFSLIKDASTTFATSRQVVGKLYAADYTSPTSSRLTTAVSDMEAAYTDAMSRPAPNHLNLGSGAIGAEILFAGLYKWTSGVTIRGPLTIGGSAVDIWIFQITGTLTMAAHQRINLVGGALPQNIFWVVAGGVILGTEAHFEGILLGATAVTLGTGATMNGRILGQTSVALLQAIVVQPQPVVNGTGGLLGGLGL